MTSQSGVEPILMILVRSLSPQRYLPPNPGLAYNQYIAVLMSTSGRLAGSCIDFSPSSSGGSVTQPCCSLMKGQEGMSTL